MGKLRLNDLPTLYSRAKVGVCVLDSRSVLPFTHPVLMALSAVWYWRPSK